MYPRPLQGAKQGAIKTQDSAEQHQKWIKPGESDCEFTRHVWRESYERGLLKCDINDRWTFHP